MTSAMPFVQSDLVLMHPTIALNVLVACTPTKVSVRQLVQLGGELGLFPTMLVLSVQEALQFLPITFV